MSVDFYKFGDPLKGAEKGLEEIVLIKAIKITAEAKSRAPYDDGILRGSIMYRTAKKVGGHEKGPTISLPGKALAVVGSALYYALYQEFGTRYMPPQPFLRPAIALHGFNKDLAEVTAKLNEAMKASLKTRFKVKFF